MAFSLGPVGLPNITPAPLVPFQHGLLNNNNNNQFPTSAGQQAPWQHNQQQNDHLWKLIQQNSQHLDRPFSIPQTTQTPTARLPWQQRQTIQFPWQQNQAGSSQQATNNNNSFNIFNNNSNNNTANGNNNTTWFEEWMNKNNNNNTSNSLEESMSLSESQESPTSKEESGKSSKEEKEEAWKELQEEMQEKAEEYFDEMKEEKEELYEDLELYTVLLFPFLLYERTTANYFAATELLSTVLTKLGVNDEDNTLLLLFIQCVDIVALSRGKFKLVEGYKQNWYQELYDYTMTRMGAPHPLRVGTQMLMPQSPAPEYIEK